MATIDFTSQQLDAIKRTGQSVIVSAAAGSGKTAVLAQRCAYLVCDAVPSERCDIDELLVLTFTDAAAAEMRERIVKAIRAKAETSATNQRLREQASLVEAAKISTIHSFCLWLIRRWFSHVGVDPSATVIDQDEAALLQREVLEAMFRELYEADANEDDPLGVDRAMPGQELRDDSKNEDQDEPAPADQVLGKAFVQLVDDYELGEDREIARFVLDLYGYVASLPTPRDWLDYAKERVTSKRGDVLRTLIADLGRELDRQAEHAHALVAKLCDGDAVGHFYAAQIESYGDWLDSVRDLQSQVNSSDLRDDKALLAAYDRIRTKISEYEFEKTRAPALSKEADPDLRAIRDAASKQLKTVKETLFKKRLKESFGLFSAEEWMEGLSETAPYVSTLVDLVEAFRKSYARRKRELNVLDFSDLERLAYDLLHGQGDPDDPSDIARSLHRRFAHVLVDEFQDINPIQQAILKLVSRESDAEREDNMFVVGDVKQSIYRFRLADPSLFSQRLLRARDNRGAIFLQKNFRSRLEILNGVNLIFQTLMRSGVGAIAYDREAELRLGREDVLQETQQPIELHVLEKKVPTPDDDLDEDRGLADLNNPARWTPIERESFLISQRIKSMMGANRLTPNGEPLRYRDIVVLLRGAKVRAEQMVSMLTSTGIPAFAEVGGSLFATREVRDVLAVLEVLDNAQQDIPLAAVLRGGVLADPIADEELAEIRCLDRDIPFHQTVRAYADKGPDVSLRQRIEALLGRIDRLRTQVRRRPLADLLWSLLYDHGYLAYVGGLPTGTQRRANLLKLHELSRKFSTFRRQGLHRFCRFIESLEQQDRSIATAAPIGETEDVVRIMSIHKSKGLEFPVVFIAGLGTELNLGDRSGRMIFDRDAGIGLRVVDTQRMIEYPSAAHRSVVWTIEQATREEELRVLYVAMTRARDKLILVGSRRNAVADATSWSSTSGSMAPPTGKKNQQPTTWSLVTARNPLDWIGAVLAGASPGTVACGDLDNKSDAAFHLFSYDQTQIGNWRINVSGDREGKSVREAVSQLDALPPSEPLSPNDPIVERVLSQTESEYAALSASSMRAYVAASEFKGAYDFYSNPEEQAPVVTKDAFLVPSSKYGSAESASPLHRGVITHRFLQRINFCTGAQPHGVASELHRLEMDGTLSPEEAGAVDRGSIEWFLTTPLGQAIQAAGDGYRREFPFVALEPVTYFDSTIGDGFDDHVLVRGIVDGILPVSGGIEIVDFKTDAIALDDVNKRAEEYRPQVELYARAMARLWQTSVSTCWLVFLSARVVHPVTIDLEASRSRN